MHAVWKSQQKVSFNIASEASYAYKIMSILATLKTWSFWSKSVTRQATLIGQKLMENAKIQMRHFELFSSQNLMENAKIEKVQNETFCVIFKQCVMEATRNWATNNRTWYNRGHHKHYHKIPDRWEDGPGCGAFVAKSGAEFEWGRHRPASRAAPV